MEWENQLIQELQWSNKISNKASKELVAQEIAGLAKDGDVIGAGSGSTVYLTLFALAQRVKQESLHIEIIPASAEISMTCIQLGLPQTTLWNKRPDWTFDGADEVDPHNNLIKGRGGAMFKEKLLIKSSGKTYIIVDESKLVSKLGATFYTGRSISTCSLPCGKRDTLIGSFKISLRLAERKDGPVFTENGNFILDIHLSNIVPDLEQKLKAITGVIESGLFIGYDITVLMANR